MTLSWVVSAWPQKVNIYKRGDWNLDEAFSFLKLRAPFELEGRDGKLDADTSRVRGYCARSHDVELNAGPQ